MERLAAWLDVQPGTRVADLGAGGGTFAISLARIVGPSGHVFATELDDERLAEIRQAATKAGVSNITAIRGAASITHLPEACCDAVFSRATYHHLTDAAAINANLFRALRPGGRLAIIDFEPGGIAGRLRCEAPCECPPVKIWSERNPSQNASGLMLDGRSLTRSSLSRD